MGHTHANRKHTELTHAERTHGPFTHASFPPKEHTRASGALDTTCAGHGGRGPREEPKRTRIAVVEDSDSDDAEAPQLPLPPQPPTAAAATGSGTAAAGSAAAQNGSAGAGSSAGAGWQCMRRATEQVQAVVRVGGGSAGVGRSAHRDCRRCVIAFCPECAQYIA